MDPIISGNDRKLALEMRQTPRGIISLVPSLTESMFDLGLGEFVIGITDYCCYPEGSIEHLPRLGGPKTPRIADILALKPDLVLANWEENTRQTVDALEGAGIIVWVTFPKTVREALDILWNLTEIFRSKDAIVRLNNLEVTFEWAKSAALDRKEIRTFCPIWFDNSIWPVPWWMTFNRDTYCHDLLHNLGFINIFADRQRRYPLEADLGIKDGEKDVIADRRYPRVILEEIREAQPEIILLPGEPFEFDQKHLNMLREWLGDTPAVREDRIHLVDGSLITWHGTRLAYALQELPALLDV